MTGRELLKALSECDEEVLDKAEVVVITTMQFGSNIRVTALTKLKNLQPNTGSKGELLLKGWVSGNA